ncbi:hypothetical protein ACJX0J_009093, partial [Zea mays]
SLQNIWNLVKNVQKGKQSNYYETGIHFPVPTGEQIAHNTPDLAYLPASHIVFIERTLFLFSKCLMSLFHQYDRTRATK